MTAKGSRQKTVTKTSSNT